MEYERFPPKRSAPSSANLAKRYAAYRFRFTSIGVSIVILEFCLGAWPIVATVLWGKHAVDTWLHFIWFLRAFLLATSIIQNRNAPWRLHYHGHDGPFRGSKSYSGTEGPATAPSVDYQGMLASCIGATASFEFSAWILASVILHAMLSAIVLLLVAVLESEFSSSLQWILSLSFNGIAIIESIGSPIALTILGLGPVYGPLAPPIHQAL